MISIEPVVTDLGGELMVQRFLPRREKRMVGPFCFFDYRPMTTIHPDQKSDVRPHPHIGLSTLTYLLHGRESAFGTVWEIMWMSLPFDVNLMTAGKGISHSERAHEQDRSQPRTVQGGPNLVGFA